MGPQTLFLNLLHLSLLHFHCYADSKTPPTKAPGKRKLTRSDGKRWDRLQEIMKSEVKSQTMKFLEDRDKVPDLDML